MSPRALPFPAIAGFRIIREIGRGGMGVVYEAEEQVLSRRVALKVLPASALHDERQVQRFEREARAAARLHHTNIVPVFGVGHQQGHHYYVMQYIDGLGLDAVLGELRLSRESALARGQTTIDGPVDDPGRTARAERGDPRDESTVDAAAVARSLTSGAFAAGAVALGPATETAGDKGKSVAQSSLSGAYFQNIARIGLQAAEALDYANRQGVLHRDVKPSNLLLDTLGNVWLADFGLAKTAEADDLTATGDIVGTIRYMAPERFKGECDARSDLYALGLTLYELVTLRPAYQGSDRLKVIERIQHGEPARLRALVANVPRDLETIIQKAIDREPARRYETAAALADDLRRFLDGRPIRARQASRPEQLARWLRRNPWVAAFLVALSLGLIVCVWQAARATQAERAARLAERATRKARDRAEEEAAKAKQSEADARAVLDFVQSKIMAAARPEGDEGGLGKDVKLRAAVDAAERGIGQSFANQRSVEASIRDTLGQSYYYLGELPLAIKQYEQALALRRQALGRDHADTLGTATNLAVAFMDTGRLAEAIPLLEESLEGTRARLGADHEQTLITMGNLAHVYGAAGRVKDALPLHEETLKRLEAKLGPEHIHTLTELNNLANAYRDAGRLEDALPLFEQALARLRKTLGHSHHTTLLAMANLGLAYEDAGKVDDAIRLDDEASKSGDAQLGPDHPDTLFFRDCLAQAYERAGRFADALPLRQGTVARWQAKAGPADPNTLTSMNNLARAYLAVKPAEAEPLMRQALAIRAKQRTDDWSKFDTTSILGASLAGQKKYAEAEPLLIDGYEGLSAHAAEIPAKMRGRVTEARDRLIRLYDDWGKKDQAEAWRRKRPKS
jgi:serine/threonine protein kinase